MRYTFRYIWTTFTIIAISFIQFYDTFTHTQHGGVELLIRNCLLTTLLALCFIGMTISFIQTRRELLYVTPVSLRNYARSMVIYISILVICFCDLDMASLWAR